MRAAVLVAAGERLRVAQVPDPQVGENSVLIRIERCGVCGSDLSMSRDASGGLGAGAILGHEYSGTVQDTGSSVDRFRRGDRVVAVPVTSCLECGPCRTGYLWRCADSSLHNGGFAEYVAVDQRRCVALPDTLTFDDGALVEPLAVALHGVNAAGLFPGARVLVLGAGPIGLGVTWWARRLGAGRIGVLASTRTREPLARAMGADIFVRAADTKPGSRGAGDLRDALGGAPDFVFECVGKPGMLARSVELVGRLGVVILLGLHQGAEEFPYLPAVLNELQIRASAFYAVHEFETAIGFLGSGYVEPRTMITDHVSLENFPEAFDGLRNGSSSTKLLLGPHA